MQLDENAIKPYLSSYLTGGYREDGIVLKSVEFEESRIRGVFQVEQFFLPDNGIFHLSASMALQSVSQLAIICVCLENGLEGKQGEVWTSGLSMKFHKPVQELTIPIAGTLEKISAPKGRMARYRFQSDVSNGSFLVDGELVMATDSAMDGRR